MRHFRRPVVTSRNDLFICTQPACNSPSGECSVKENKKKKLLSKLFLLKWLFLFVLLVAGGVPRASQASIFSGIWKILAGQETAASPVLSAASVSLPLLGSNASFSYRQEGVGGPVDDAPPAMPVVQDSALVAPRNPAGTLSNARPDQILLYVVQQGDTPGAIAENFGISLNTLLWANNIRNSNTIKIGDELVILPVSGVRYAIKKGDTIESIAKSFKGDANEILSFNGLAVDEALTPGTIIIIPDGELFSLPSQPVSPRYNRFTNLPEERGYYLRPIVGGRKSRGIHGHNGVDLANSCGLPIYASAGGTVIIARASGWNGGYGKYAVITHANDTQTLYGHMSAVAVTQGMAVAQGFQIGDIGSTGNSTGCHVHFEIRGARNPF